jgi:type IV pilus assembly protein PilC
LASFIEAGSSLHTALDLLQDQASKPAIKEVISGIIEKLEGGSSFSEAVKSYPRVFSNSYWQVIQSSEKAGNLEIGLKQIAAYLENRSKITGKIKHALAYPAFVILLAIGVVVLLITTVLPPMLKLFSSFQADLPRITLFALALMNFVLDYKFQLLAAIILVTAIGILVYRLPSGRLAIDRLTLKIPLFGTIILEHNMGHFCRTASMLLAAGIPLPGILDIAIQALDGNRVILRSFITLKEKLMQGEGLARPMSGDSVFPRMMVRMVTVGEQTGTLDSSLNTLANYYEEHTDKRIQGLISMIEPTLTVAIGIGIAFIMVSMVLPIYTIINHVH